MGRSSSSASNTALSLVLAAVTSSDSGNPVPSAARCSLDPCLAGSTGFAPVWSPPNSAQAERVHTHPRPVHLTGRAELIQQHLLEPLEHPGACPLGQPPPTGVTDPQPNSCTGSSAHSVQVRAMNTIAAMHDRSDTVRGAPPRAWEGGGGSSLRQVCGGHRLRAQSGGYFAGLPVTAGSGR
jgi:hypothetical protein